MRSSIDQVLDVLNGWKDAVRILAVILESKKGDSIKLGGIVAAASNVALLVSSGDINVEIHLSPEMEFDWQAPKRDRTSLPEASPYDSFLQIRSADFSCLISALKLKDERVDT